MKPNDFKDSNPAPQEEESFRDRMSNVDKDGNRIWIYPTKPKGRYYNWRKITSVVLLTFLFTGPFINIGGLPLLRLNLLERKFYILGTLFTPQDFYIFVIGALLFLVFIGIFTVVYGRVFCGWVCPQTIFMEMVFRRIEYWIEGDAGKQRALNKAPWTNQKIFKKTTKHTIFLAISLIISHTFLSYVVGPSRVYEIVRSGPIENWGLFTGLLIFTGLFYGVFAFFREQVCTQVCPYGRMQGVLLGQDSISVAYDYVRGEPRGKVKRNINQEELGDCVDCDMCVKVCPTGIDIRDGVQLECVNCTACIDACDDIMDRFNRPRGLIRYASPREIEEKLPFKISPRMIAYSVVLFILAGVMTSMLLLRNTVEVVVIRTAGQTYQMTEEGNVRNLYTVQLSNKTDEELPIQFVLLEPEGKLIPIQEKMILGGEGSLNAAFFIEIAPEKLNGARNDILIEVRSEERILKVVKSNFLGPNPN
ncbi:MAG: cytochrome c oxidase accessory protein CcoG [Bernardetiaceae bacterium]|nr:cytochrome c oxidase accessory protein CcoG [Bernardetiaceae bacterium]